jgi:hypothetical protein
MENLMGYMKFNEYLDRKKKMITSPKVKAVADYEGEIPKAPKKEKKNKDAGGKGQVGKIEKYSANQGRTSAKKGFGEEGNKDLKIKYDNKTEKNVNGVPGGKNVSGWVKTNTREWIERNKKLSLAEFAKKIHQENQKGLKECDCQDTHSTVKNIIDLCKCNKKYVSSLVREMKRRNLFNNLMKEMIKHEETFQALAKLMNEEVVARKLVKAINEMVAPPVGYDKDEEDNSPEPKNMNPDDMDHDDHDEMDHDDKDHDDKDPDDMDHDDKDHDDKDHDEMDHDDKDHDEMDHDEMDHDEMDHDEMDHDDHDVDFNMNHDDMDHDDHDDMDHDDHDMHKNKAHHHLMKAIKDHPALMNKNQPN